MKKLVSFVLSVVLILSLSVPVFGSEQKSKTLSVEIIQSLSTQDLIDCYDMLLAHKEEKPFVTNDQLDALATNFYISTYQNKLNTPAPMIYDGLGLNPDEAAMARQYPSDLAAYGSSANIAMNESENRYWAGSYYGNKDAFRHASWNALLVCRFYALGKGDVNWCINRTRLWTNAHETGSIKPANQSAAQWEVDQEMDYLNNAAGRAAAETTYTSEALALQKVQHYVDNGYCKRIKTDAQMTWDPEDMWAKVPVWTLRTTNTVGKN